MRHPSHKNEFPILSTEIAIVGAGVMGCQLAYALSKHYQVMLLEAGEIGRQGASSLPLALLNPLRGRSARMQSLDWAGLRAMGSLEPTIKQHAVYHTGVLRIASNARQAKTWRKRLQEYADRIALTWLEPNEVPSHYHAPFGALLVEEAGYVVPARLLANLLEAACVQGAQIWDNARVLAIQQDTVKTKHALIQAEHIFLCVGADPQGLALAKAASSDLERMAGEIVSLSADVSLDYPLAGAVYGAQHQQRMYVGGNHRPAKLLNEQSFREQSLSEEQVIGQAAREAAQHLQQSAGWFIPSLLQATRTDIWTGVRCKTKGALPRVVSLTPRLHFVGAMAGRGFLCSAYVAQEIARTL